MNTKDEEFSHGSILDRLDIRKLSIEERIQLVGEIWDSIAEEEKFELTEAQREEIERRLISYWEGRERGIPWEVVKNRIQNAQ